MDSTGKGILDADKVLRDGANSITESGPSKSDSSAAKLFAMKLQPPPIPGKISKFKENELKAAVREVLESSGDVSMTEYSLWAEVDSPTRTDSGLPGTKTKLNDRYTESVSVQTSPRNPNAASSQESAKSELDTSTTSTSDSIQDDERPFIKVDMISKVLVVGNAKCGKSSIISRYASQKFDEEYKTTIGADFVRRDVLVSDPDLEDEPAVGVRMHLWDIAGQDRFQKLTRAYFNRAKAVVIVCDVSREGTVDAVTAWKREIDTWAMSSGTPNIPVVLFANKSDLLQDATCAFKTGATMEKMCREHDFLGWWITSARTGESLDEGFYALLQQVVRLERHAKEAAIAGDDANTRHNRGPLGTAAVAPLSRAERGGPFKLGARPSGQAYDPYANNITDCC